jgi:serine/threonine-protein kinase
MGEVFLAKISGAAGFEKPCIVKTILPALLKDRQFLDRFHHEAKVLVHLVHSSIAQVYDMGEADGTYYMALEYVAGVDLAYLLEQARAQGVAVPVPVALFIGQRIAEGLGYAHRKAGPDGTPLGIVHRDVSPHNVMVSYEGEVKVIDFGLAKSAARSKYTLPSTVMGKLGYMSPEQVRAEPVDHRSDIYSSGVVMWEMLASRPLIPHGTVGEMMAAMSQPVVPALHEQRPDVDTALDAVVRRALEAKPDGRYARTDEWARALNGELVRTAASVGAEEVGQFVRTLCPEAFAAQRKLISKVSSSSASLRRSPLPGTGTGVYGTGPRAPSPEDEVTGHEPTVVRNVSDIQPPGRRSGGVARPDAVYADEDDTDSGATSLRQGPPSATSRFEGTGSGARRTSRPAPTVEVEDDGDDELTVPARRNSRPAQTVKDRVADEVAVSPRRSSRPLPVSAAEEAPARESRRRPVGLYAAIAVLLVIATAATTALLLGQPVASPGPTAANPGQAVKPGAETPGAAPGTAAPTSGTAGQAGTAAPGTAPVTAETPAAGGQTPGTTPPGTPAPGTPAPGTAVAAAPGTGTAEVVSAGGQGTPVAEVAPSSAGGAAPGKEDEAAEPDRRPTSTAKAPGKKKPVTSTPAPAEPAAPTVRSVPNSVPVKLLVEEAGRFYVERGWALGLAPDMTVEVVGPAGKDGRRPVLGSGRVQKPTTVGMKLAKIRQTYVELDEAALAAGGNRYVVLPRSTETAPGTPAPETATQETASPAPAEAAVGAEKRELYGAVSKQGGVAGRINPGITVQNLGTFDWTGCHVVKDLRMKAWLGNLKSGDKTDINNKRFKFDKDSDLPSNQVGVYCKEGQFITTLR